MKPNDPEMMPKLQKESEALFMKLCDSNNFAFLYIHQDLNTISSKLWLDSKRPDFLVSLPYIGSFFFDVKASRTVFFYENDYKKIGAKSPTIAFTFKYEEIIKFKNLYHGTALPVWFAVFPTKENKDGQDQVLEDEHLIPIDRIEKFIIDRHKSKEWPWIQVPIICFVNSKNLTQNKCKDCDKRYCEKFEDIINGKKR